MTGFESFHFLRPWWLLAFLPAAVVWWRLRRAGDITRMWASFVDPDLLAALLGGEHRRRRIRPVHVLGLFWLIAILALAGPAWQREASPFAEDRAALVIALKVAPSMEDNDIAPSRQQRAALKITDLMAARPGARHGLVAYAGSAHLVMPLTTDAAVINTFAVDLTADLMPVEGDDAAVALKLAARQLRKRNQPGAILFITDDLDESAITAIAEHRRQGGVPVHVWAATAASPPPLAEAARAGGGWHGSFTADAADVERLARRVQQTATAPGTDDGQRWRDSGYLLVPLLALMALLWFRRGWVVAHA